ncbi:MAG: 4'-phosphopantetheinyl transferase family protein, partial [Gemmatimonadaceae bacterium]
RVSRTDTGKPVITEGVHFNLTHSGDLILLALTSDRAIGVDVERRRPVTKVHALTDRWLSETERRHFDGLRALGESDSDAFLRVWSLKEAQLKALGVGISGASSANLAGVEVLPLDGLLDRLDGPHAGQGYVGAVAFA